MSHIFCGCPYQIAIGAGGLSSCMAWATLGLSLTQIVLIKPYALIL